MSSEEDQTPISTASVAEATAAEAAGSSDTPTIVDVEKERAEKILKAKELYSQGSRNLLLKSYAEAADELSQVCALYVELHGDLSDELGMPYLLYAKALISLALDENKVIDVPDEEEDDSDDEDDEGVEDAAGDEAEAANGEEEAAVASSTSAANGEKKSKSDVDMEDAKEVEKKNDDEVDSTEKTENPKVVAEAASAAVGESAEKTSKADVEETQVSSSSSSGKNVTPVVAAADATVMDDERPSTSNGKTSANGDDEADDEAVDEDNEVASSLQLAWEILELAAKIFTRQGMSGLPNLAEVHTELGNIEFENSILSGAREDYERSLKIYKELPTKYRRAMAEIHYKIGLTYLMQQMNREGAESLKEACTLIDAEIEDIKSKPELTEKDKNNIQDMEETKQEIWSKIAEIEETQAQNIAEVRAALDSYIKPITSSSSSSAANGGASSSSAMGEAAASSSSSSSITSSSKPSDISHLIKRKKPEDRNSEAEAASSPAKRPAL